VPGRRPRLPSRTEDALASTISEKKAELIRFYQSRKEKEWKDEALDGTSF